MSQATPPVAAALPVESDALNESREASTSGLGWVALAVLTCGYVLLFLSAGAPDSPLAPVLPGGVRPATWMVRASDWLSLSDRTRSQLTVISIVLIAALLGAFALLVRESWHGRVRFRWVMGAVLVAVGLAVAAPVLLSRDVYSYAAYGRILAIHGSNPYAQPPSAFPADPFVVVASREWINTRSVYGPAFTLLSWSIAHAWSGSPGATIVAFKLAAGVAVMGAAFLAAFAARGVRPGAGAAAAAMVGLNPVVLIHTVGGGHNDALIALLVAGAFALAVWAGRDEREQAGRRMTVALGPAALSVTLLLTMAVLIKAVMVPLLVLWLCQVWRRSGRGRDGATASGIHALLAAMVAAASFLPVQAGWSTVRALLSVSSRQGWASGPGLVARGARTLGRSLGGSTAGAVLEVTVSAMFVALFLWLFWRILAAGDVVPDAEAWGGSILLLALAAPYLLPWYAAWFLPLLGSMRDRILVASGLGVSVVLALTGVPAEGGSAPHVWSGMVSAVHDVAAPLMLLLLAAVALRIVGLTGSPTTSAGAHGTGARSDAGVA
jgi:alpha-1,6-mannosyltransferase